jgi:hypothetical protein
MAIISGVQRGQAPYQVNGAEAVAPARLGVSVGNAYTGAAVTIALPADTSTNGYSCVRISAACAYWIAFTTGSGNASVGGANCSLVTPGQIYDCVVPPLATSISVIADTGTTIGGISITGIY